MSRISLLILVTPLFALAQEKPNFDYLLSQENALRTGFQVPSSFHNRVSQIAPVEWQKPLGIPTFIFATQSDSAKRVKSDDPESIARAALSEYAGLYRYSTATLSSADLKYVHDVGKGPIIVKFKQTINGLEVFRAETNVVMTRNLDLFAISGYLFPHNQALASAFILNPEQALCVAWQDLFGQEVSPTFWAEDHQEGGYTFFNLSRETPNDLATLQPVRIKPVLYGTADTFRPAYFMEVNGGLAEDRDGSFYAYVIDAENGQLLLRENQVVSDSFTYRVWAQGAPGSFVPFDGPQGNAASPHPTGTPDGYQESFVSAPLITLQNVPFSQNDPWLPAGATETIGNNVDAYVDISGGDGYNGSDFRANTTSTGTFDYTFDHANPTSTTSRKAAILQIFYINNYLHDLYYDYGFDEISGNAQANNFGRGGLGNDRILAEGQDFGGTNNANMSTPADGLSPRMQMYIFSGPNPDRDGTIDYGISAHEWGHYISSRLIPGLFNSSQGASMSEGWGDITALINTVEDGDNYDGAYATGAYATYLAFGLSFENNFYFGIRRYPYSTDFSKNGLTFKHIGGPISNLPPGVPISSLGVESNGNSEVHNAGEVWCTTFWECYKALLDDRSDFADAKDTILTYLTAAYKMTPGSPTFLEARNAMIAAAGASNPDDFVLFWEAYARRGMGPNAIGPARNDSSHSGIVEDFSPGGADVQLVSIAVEEGENCDSDGIVDAGEKGTLSIQVLNSGLTDLASVTATVSSLANIAFDSGGVVNFNPINVLQTGTAQIGFKAAGSIPSLAEIDIHVEYQGTGTGPKMADTTFLANYDVVPHSVSTDPVEYGENGWTTSVSVGTQPWVISEARAASSSHAWFGFDAPSPLDSALMTPAILVPAVGNFTFSFKHAFSFESGNWDGGVLELSTDLMNWVDIGGSASPTYNGTIEINPDSPISNRPAYVNNSPGWPAFSTVNVNLGTTYNGQTVYIRWRVGCDTAEAAEGWYIDDISFPTLATPLFESWLPEADICQLCPGVQTILNSIGANEWPNPNSILDYVSIFNTLCP